MAVALITGCSSGFGLLTALELARRGDTVYASMRNLAKADDLERRAEKEHLAVTIVPLDVTDDASVRSAVGRVLTESGRIDVVVNNAGIGILGAVEEIDDDEALLAFDTNVLGVIRVCRAVLPPMRAQGSGTIVNVSSISGLIVPPFLTLYSATKFALEALSESLYHEVEPFGIKVTIVEPGFFKTEIMDNARVARRSTDRSAYWAGTRRVLDRQTRGVNEGPDAQEVADRIADLAHAPAPPLRNPVGAGTDDLLRTRRQVTDEQMAALVRQAYGI